MNGKYLFKSIREGNEGSEKGRILKNNSKHLYLSHVQKHKQHPTKQGSHLYLPPCQKDLLTQIKPEIRNSNGQHCHWLDNVGIWLGWENFDC